MTAMRNEGPFVLDWVAHHRAIGVTDFLVYSNDCDDGTDRLLDTMSPAGVHHVRHSVAKGSVQWQALKAAKDHPVYGSVDWAASLDCDEFINLRDHADLPALVADWPAADAIAMNWRFFGHSGHLQFEDVPTTDRFTQAAPLDLLFPAASRFCKTLYQTDAKAFARPGIHRPKQRPGKTAHWVDGCGRSLPEDWAVSDDRIVLAPEDPKAWAVRINHYSLRSAEDFMVKRARGLPNRKSKPVDATYWAERNFNSVADTSIQRFAPAVAAERSALLELPGLAEAHEASVAAHQAKIVAILENPDERSLFTRLALLTGSEAPDTATQRALLKLVHQGPDGSGWFSGRTKGSL